MLPTAIREVEPGVAAARALINSLDAALMAGFARLGPDQKLALDRVAAALGPSPLGPRVAEAVAAVRAGPPSEADLLALAAAREALQGACHDALLIQALSLLGRAPEVPTPATTPAQVEGRSLTLLGSARQWLTELALGGLIQADPGSVGPFLPTLEQLQEDPGVRRTSALLTGLWDELMDLLPLSTPDEAPATRWGDLWSRALLSCTGRSDQPTSSSEKGRFSCFAVEIRHHAHLVSAVLWGLWEPAGSAPRVARTTLSGWRVPAIAGPESWHALRQSFGPLLTAVAEKRAWDATASVLSSGDLRLSGGAPGPTLDPLEVAKRAMSPDLPLPVALAADRHPAQISLPLLLSSPPAAGCKQVPFGDGALPLRWDRLSPLQEVGDQALLGCPRWVGLLQWDDGAWAVQPLYGLNTAGKKPVDVGPHATMAEELKGKSEALAILKERAGKLLRAKS